MVPVLSVRVSDDLAARFDAAAAAGGGRSALLRRLVRDAAAPAAPEGRLPPARRDALRLMVRLAAPDADHVISEARVMEVRPAAWVAALVRHHACGTARYSRAGELTLVAIHGELRRIGVNLNQVARALNTAVLEGRVLDLQLAGLDDFRRELRAHIAALREALLGRLSYWEVPP